MPPKHASKRRKLNFDTPAGTHRQTFPLDDVLAPAEEAPMNSFVDRVSLDGRRVHRTEVPIGAPASPVKAARLRQLEKAAHSHTSVPNLSSPFVTTVVDQDAYQMSLWLDGAAPSNDLEPPATNPFESGNSRVNPADPALAAWAENDRDAFLDLLLWNDGRRGRGLSSACTFCNTGRLPHYRCRECHSQEPMCEVCCVAAHSEQPLHWIERWNGSYFSRTSLRALGLRVQLGHPPGEACSAPHPAHSDFTVIHSNGIHSVAVDFCACHLCKDAHHVQLLRTRWYPATSDQPRTCATFVALDAAHAMSLSSKATLFAFYEHLEWLTDGSGSKPTDRYKALLRIMREYRHLLLLKRAGRGHAVGGVKGTSSGELAVRCPACPRPGINLPANWQEAAARDHCLYTQFIAVDVCFRLKRGMVSSNAKDPPLSDGWAYMVEGRPYREYLLTIKDQEEISSCTDLAALDHANTKFAKGYTTTGVGMAVCARHEFVLPNSVGDLQRGERYGNMDYILASALRHISRLLRLVVSYDIACQWWKGLRDRLDKLPPLVRLSIILAMVRFVVPKMHIKGHTMACQLLFSLLLTLGCGQTDGEGIERLWAAINALAGSTKLNGPGARSDQLDDHWGFSNWAKLVRLPALLRRRLDAARKESAKQTEAFQTFNDEQIEHAPEWLEMVTRFEAPRADGAPEPRNPYEATVTGKSEKEVRAEFEEDDKKDAAAGVPRIHGTSPRSLMMFGLELEELQSRIRVQAALKKAKSTASKINVGNMRRKAEGMMRQWRSLQATYAPAAVVHLKGLNIGVDTLIEDIPLLPPSALSAKQRATGCHEELFALEVTLREAQCRVALVALRNQLHIKSRLVKYKKLNSRHQHTNTRTRTLVNRNESKIKLHAEKYQRAWTALSALLGTTGHAFTKLKAADIRCMEDPDSLDERVRKESRRMKRRADLIAQGDLPLIDSKEETLRDETDDSDDAGVDDEGNTKSGEGRRTMSWIWYSTGKLGSEEEMADALRIEWCKAYSRSRRWKEEVRMLSEEQRRVPVSLQHEADKWVGRGQMARDLSPSPLSSAQAEVLEGKIAYAAKQRDLYLTLKQRAEEVRTAPEGKRRRAKPTAAADTVHPDLPDAASDSSDDDEEDYGEEPVEEGDAEDIF
ncbi:CxC2 domain-containing protein [Mycena chlorophos]|uniref:CxC2 domain-containing protein n=1 Tax=Mycena chlorophos TaxID=658473 RepID=A0A8H6TX99_MYCCL|nr:CxC2 domain-containing protein [Mycena chlorophos]